MKLKKLKSILACVLVLCMLFGVQSNLAFAQENDDTIAQENVADSTTMIRLVQQRTIPKIQTQRAKMM